MSAQIVQNIVKDDGTVIGGFSQIEQPFAGSSVFLVWQDAKCGLLDEDGNEICPCKYITIKMIKTADKVLYWAMSQEEGNTKSVVFLDEQGNELPCGSFDEACIFSKEGFAVVKRDNKLGLIKTNGEFMLQCEYDIIDGIVSTMRINGYLPKFGQEYYFMSCDGKGGIFSNQGIVVEALYDSVYNWNGDFYITELNRKIGIILLDGSVICEPQYDNIGSYPYSGLYKVFKSGYVGLISAKNGSEIMPCDCYSEIEWREDSFDEGVVIVKKEVATDLILYGILSLEDFKEVIPCKYSNIFSYRNNIASVEFISGAIGYITSEGKEVKADKPFVKALSGQVPDEDGNIIASFWDESKGTILYCYINKDGIQPIN